MTCMRIRYCASLAVPRIMNGNLLGPGSSPGIFLAFNLAASLAAPRVRLSRNALFVGRKVGRGAPANRHGPVAL